MGVKTCAGCGETFNAQRNARNCPACRGAETLAPVPAGGVLAATRAQLDTIGRIDTPLGATALVLAGRLDAGADPGSAMAAMAKELRGIMSELLAGAPAVSDPVDELRARRKKRLGA